MKKFFIIPEMKELICGEDVYAALVSETDLSEERIAAIGDMLMNPSKKDITEIEVEDGEAGEIACGVCDYYMDRINKAKSRKNAPPMGATWAAAKAAMTGMGIEHEGGWQDTLEAYWEAVTFVAPKDAKEDTEEHGAAVLENEICEDKNKDEDADCNDNADEDTAGECADDWRPEIVYAGVHSHLLVEAVEIHEQHPEGITGRVDENGWVLFSQHEACQAAEEMGVDMQDFYAYARMEGFMTLEGNHEDSMTAETASGTYHIMPYEIGWTPDDPFPDMWPY